MDEDLQKPSVKQKVDVKRIKKKANLNISRGNLPSGSKKFNCKFNFLGIHSLLA